jgi:hypothetical protein
MDARIQQIFPLTRKGIIYKIEDSESTLIGGGSSEEHKSQLGNFFREDTSNNSQVLAIRRVFNRRFRRVVIRRTQLSQHPHNIVGRRGVTQRERRRITRSEMKELPEREDELESLLDFRN